MKKKSSRFFASVMVLLLLSSIIPLSVNATTPTHVSDEAGLRTAIASSNYNIVLDNDITLSSDTGDLVNGAKFCTVNSGTIDGNGHTIKAAVTGTDDMGVLNSGSSDYYIFNFHIATVNLKNVTIKGGAKSAIYQDSGNLTMENVTVTCTGSATCPGGGIYNFVGNTVLNNCSISRNVAEYGGGFLNNGGKMILNNCSVTENRNIGGGNKGGGGCQNGGSGTLYLNNCTFSNNQSTEIGGAINNSGSTLYVTNSTICGNISNFGSAISGGGIGNNNGNVYCANSIIANNYATKPGGTYINSDIGLWIGTNVNMYYCMVGAYINTDNGGTCTPNTNIDNVNISSDNVFSAYANCFSMKADGVKDATVDSSLLTKKRPILVKMTVSNVPQFVAPLDSLYSTNYSSPGADTYLYYNADLSTVQMAYNSGALTSLIPAGSTDLTNKVTTYQDGTTRASNIVGAYGLATTSYYTLTVMPSSNGSVSGGSVYGDAYESGTTVTLTPVADSSYHFTKWQKTTDNGTTWTDCTSSDINEYTVTMSANLTIRAVFEAGTGYAVKVNNGTGNRNYLAGETVTIKANNAPSGKKFDKWTVVSGSAILANSTSATTTFTMPANAVEVSATYTDINAGTVTKDSEISNNAPSASITDSIDGLKAIILSNDELTQVSNGNNIEILLKVNDASSTVSQTDKNLVSGNLGGYTVGQYLDLSLWKIIGNTETQLTTVNSPITVTFEIPNALKNSNSSTQRTYKVVRIHDGAVSVLNDLDKSNDTITISTDKFSTYVIVYDDAAAVNTGDKAPILSMLVVLIVSGVGLIVIIKRKKLLLIK